MSDGLREYGMAAKIEEVYEVNLANGWFEEERTLDEEIALLHSEVSEMLEAYRSWGLEDATKPITDETEINLGKIPKPEGVGSEVADVLIRLLDFSKRHEIEGEQYDRWHTDYRTYMPETFGGQVAFLHTKITRLYDEKGSWPEAVRVFAALLSICKANGLDLFAEYDRKIEHNRLRGYRHGGKRL